MSNAQPHPTDAQTNAAGGPLHLDDNNFATEIAKGLVFVDFWAEWCGPCKMVAPTIQELARDPQFTGKVKIAKLNVDESPATAGKYGVMSIPTFILFKDGAPVDGMVGAMPKHMFVDFLQRKVAENAPASAPAQNAA